MTILNIYNMKFLTIMHPISLRIVLMFGSCVDFNVFTVMPI